MHVMHADYICYYLKGHTQFWFINRTLICRTFPSTEHTYKNIGWWHGKVFILSYALHSCFVISWIIHGLQKQTQWREQNNFLGKVITFDKLETYFGWINHKRRTIVGILGTASYLSIMMMACLLPPPHLLLLQFTFIHIWLYWNFLSLTNSHQNVCKTSVQMYQILTVLIYILLYCS